MSTSPGAADTVEGSGRERRRFPRVRGPFDGSWAGAAGRGTARIWDLSVGGCYIDALNDQRNGEILSVTIALPEGQVDADGEIVYSNPNQGFAVKFVTMPDAARHLLHQAVDRLLAEGQGT
jgi:hypothetical protein